MTRPYRHLLAAALLAAAVGAVAAQPATPAELGQHEFESNCATCHGMTGLGDGPMRPFLARVPADLTTVARRNGGTFPKTAIADDTLANWMSVWPEISAVSASAAPL